MRYLILAGGYIGIMILDLEHPLLIVDDMGQDLLSDESFKVKWNTTRQLRRAFFSDARLSALNLVELAGRSHNDIRPANIVKWGHSFCLVDFHMACGFVVSQEGTAFSPNIRSSGWQRSEKMTFFTVAHIAVTVFILSAERRFDFGTVHKSSIR